MTDISKYDQEFYENRDQRTRYAAKLIVNLVNNLVHPGSVVDLGCGVGTWLDVFKQHGVDEVLGIEGPWVDKAHLVIQEDEFMSAELDKPLNLNRRFDLAISLEVAEHITENNADNFVNNLVSLAPVILFSAAIPLQGGRNHVNEQWPSYWRAKFGEHGYVCADVVRNEVWQDEKLDVWYAQNCFIYIDEKALENYPELKGFVGKNAGMIDAVHPRMFEGKMYNYSLSKWMKNKMGKLK